MFLLFVFVTLLMGRVIGFCGFTPWKVISCKSTNWPTESYLLLFFQVTSVLFFWFTAPFSVAVCSLKTVHNTNADTTKATWRPCDRGVMTHAYKKTSRGWGKFLDSWYDSQRCYSGATVWVLFYVSSAPIQIFGWGSVQTPLGELTALQDHLAVGNGGGRRKGRNLKERERKNDGESGRLRGKEWGRRKVAANSNFSLKAIGGWVSCLGRMDTPASGRLLFVIQY